MFTQIVVTPTMVWLLAGVALCLIEFVVPTAFIAFVMGLSALVVAAFSNATQPTSPTLPKPDA